MSERSDIVKPIMDALEKVPGVLAIRVNSGGYRGRMRGAPAGTADILGVLASSQFTWWRVWRVLPKAQDGQFFAIEAKLPNARTGKRTAKAQADFAERVRQLGGLYVVAHSVAEALAGLGLTP